MAIRGAFIAVFDQTAGRKIAHQSPDGFIGAETFDAISEYVIPKPQLCGQLVRLCALGSRVLGFPVCIEDAKYPRNALLFNLCFVLDGASDDDDEAHGAVLSKLARSLRTLEMEAGHVSEPARRAELALLLPRLIAELNESGQCTLCVDVANTLHLRLLPPAPAPRPSVRAHDVPVLVAELGRDALCADLTLRCLLPHLDGRQTASAVAAQAGCDLGWALDALTDLVALGVVALTDSCWEQAVYAPTRRLQQLARTEAAQLACAQHCKRPGRPAPRFQTVFALYCRTGPRADGSWPTVADAGALAEDELDVRRCIQFGTLNGYLRRVHAYPRLEPAAARAPPPLAGLPAELLDGCHSLDEIACTLGCSRRELHAALDGSVTWVMRVEADGAGAG